MRSGANAPRWQSGLHVGRPRRFRQVRRFHLISAGSGRQRSRTRGPVATLSGTTPDLRVSHVSVSIRRAKAIPWKLQLLKEGLIIKHGQVYYCTNTSRDGLRAAGHKVSKAKSRTASY